MLDFPHPSANQGLVLTTAVVSTYHFPSPFHTTFCLPTQEEEDGDSNHTVTVYITEIRYGSRGDQNNAYPSRAGFSVFHNTK